MLSEGHDVLLRELTNNRSGACSRKHHKSKDVQQKDRNISSNLEKTNSVTHKPTYLFVTLLMTGMATVTMRPRPDASKYGDVHVTLLILIVLDARKL